MQAAEATRAAGFPSRTLNTPTEILKSLRQKKIANCNANRKNYVNLFL
jgi:hypothetical protein